MNNKDLWKNAENIRTKGYKPDFNFGNQWHSVGTITKAVVILCVIIFILEFVYSEAYGLLIFYPELNLENFLHQPWRLISPSFMHGDWIHLAFNLVIWWLTAQLIEKQQGKTRLLLLLALTTTLPNIAQFLVSGPFFLGLSGVVMGMVSYCVSYTFFAKRNDIELQQSIIIAMVISLLFGLLYPSQIANIAHITGAITGAITGFVFANSRNH